jgi:hypothetical protein
MKKYTVDISPAGKEELWNYILDAREFGDSTVEALLDSYDDRVTFLEKSPYGGTDHLPYLPEKYRALHLWKHYWLIYQIYEADGLVKIEYVVDDRQNYISFIH